MRLRKIGQRWRIRVVDRRGPAHNRRGFITFKTDMTGARVDGPAVRLAGRIPYFSPQAFCARSSTSAAFLRAVAAPSPRISRTRSGWATSSSRRCRAGAK